MSSVAQVLGFAVEPHPLRDAFLRWQCRVRQMTMRDKMGRPDEGMCPELTLAGDTEPLGAIITVLNKLPTHSMVPEFQHMVKRTHDPAGRRDKALQLFSETYYQKSVEFSDTLTSSFPPNSPGAAKIREAERVTLTFEAYAQKFTLECKVWALTKGNALYQATWWHNHLFNPDLSGDAVILGFEPDWDASTAEPPIGGRG